MVELKKMKQFKLKFINQHLKHHAFLHVTVLVQLTSCLVILIFLIHSASNLPNMDTCSLQIFTMRPLG